MSQLIFGQMSLWIFAILGSAAIWIITLKLFREKQHFSIQINVIFLILLFGFYAISISSCIESDDFCINNGHVTSGKYEESWTEQYTETESYTDSKGNTHYRTVTKTRFHPESYEIKTTVGSIDTDRAHYFGLVKRFSNQQIISDSHYGQISHGDGRTFKTSYNGSQNTFVPASNKQNIDNWIKASKATVLKRKGQQPNKVLPYPDLCSSDAGVYKQKRILVDNVSVNSSWIQAMEWNMDVLADNVGATYQCNPLIYITDKDPAFFEDIKDAWIGGKKNDVVVVIGVKKWPNPEWVKVMSWTADERLSPYVEDKILSVNNLDSGLTLVNDLQGGIQHYFKRKRMHSFEYLLNDIQSPDWIEACGFLLTLLAVLASFMQRKFVNEDEYNYRPRY